MELNFSGMVLGANTILELRIPAYEVLRQVFSTEPSREFLQMLDSTPVLQFFTVLKDQVDPCLGIKTVKSYLESNRNDIETALERTRSDYFRLFTGPGDPLVPPWGSVYANEERLLFQEQTLAVRRFYLKYCLLPADYPQVADDHLGLELEFICRTSQMALEMINKEDYSGFREIIADQLAFIGQLQCWLPVFCEQLFSNAQTDYFRGMADILLIFLREDANQIEQLLAESSQLYAG